MHQTATALSLIATLILVPVATGGPIANVSISDVEVSPAAPAPGETVRFTATAQNLEGNSGFKINSVVIRGVELTSYGRTSEPGVLAPGTSLDIPVTAMFDTSGTKELRMTIYGRDKVTGDKLQIRYPVHLKVKERHPQIGINTNDSVAGVMSHGEVTVANGLGTEMSNIEVRINGEDVHVSDNKVVKPSINESGSVTIPFQFRPNTSGTQQLTARVRYVVGSNGTRTTTQTTTIEPEPLRDKVYIDTTAVGDGTSRALQVTISNGANAPISDMVLSARSDNASFQRAFINNIPASSSKQVRLNATLEESRANATVTADYELGTSARQVNTTTEIRSSPSSIVLSGIDVAPQGNRIQISGSASNIGRTIANGVLVRVPDTQTVTPVAPNRDYFVGTVPGGDFASFEVYARTEENVTAIPVEVSYVVESDRKTKQFFIPLGSQKSLQATPDSTAENDQGILFAAFSGGVIIVLFIATMIYRYRTNSRKARV